MLPDKSPHYKLACTITMNSTSSKTRSKNFFEQTRLAEARFEKLGLSRPQDTYSDLLRRARQINFGVLNCETHQFVEEIKKWEPSKEMLVGESQNSTPINPDLKARWIQTQEDFNVMMEKLWKCSEVSLDIECHSHRTFSGRFAKYVESVYGVMECAKYKLACNALSFLQMNIIYISQVLLLLYKLGLTRTTI